MDSGSGHGFTLDPSIADLLACPACRGTLCFAAGQANTNQDDLSRDEQSSMNHKDCLICSTCGRIYPAAEGIPRLIAEK